MKDGHYIFELLFLGGEVNNKSQRFDTHALQEIDFFVTIFVIIHIRDFRVSNVSWTYTLNVTRIYLFRFIYFYIEKKMSTL